MKPVEYFVVARNNEDPNMPREIIERYFVTENRGVQETFDKAMNRQRWLKFQNKDEHGNYQRWQDCRLYEGVQMKPGSDSEGKFTFVSAMGEG